MTTLAAPVPFAGVSPSDPPQNPRWDVTFIDRCLVDLFTHWGQYRPLGRLYAAHVTRWERCVVVREAVDWGRRLGFEIEGDKRRGYRVVAFQHPERVYLVKPGPQPRDEAGASTRMRSRYR